MGQKVKSSPPPGGIFVDPHIFVVWTLAFKNLVVGWKIDAGCGHNKLVSLATHAIFLIKDCNALRCHILAIYVFKSTLLVSKY